jgi:hypothetical protein
MCVERCGEVRNGHADFTWWTVRLSCADVISASSAVTNEDGDDVHVHQAGFRLYDDIVSRCLPEWPSLPVAGDRCIYELRVDFTTLVVPQTHSRAAIMCK